MAKMRKQSGLHHPVSVYAKQVAYGKLHDMCCPYEIKACERHLRDLKRQGTKEFPYVFDTTRADRIIEWFSQCIQLRGVVSCGITRMETTCQIPAMASSCEA